MLPLCYARLVRELGQGSLPMWLALLKSSGFQAGRAAITRLLKKASSQWPHHLAGLKGSLRQQGPFLYAMRVGLSDKQDNPRSTARTPRTALSEGGFRRHDFETILTRKRASRIKASHLSGKRQAGPRFKVGRLCSPLSWLTTRGQ